MTTIYNTTIALIPACRKIFLSLLIPFVFGTNSPAQSESGHGHEEEENHASHELLEEGKEEDEHGDEHSDEHGDEHGDEDDRPIQLGEKDIQDFGILVSSATSGTIHDELRVQGEFRMNENAMSHISPRFDGIVTKINKRLGDMVEAGDVLAEMESNETLRPFQLKAPFDGTIVSFRITSGESLDAGEVAFTVVDTSTVWVDLSVYQHDLPKVHIGQKVSVYVGHEYPEADAEISYVGPVVNETSRTGLIRAVLDNTQGFYRPGLFVIGNVLLDENQLPVVVPRSSVLTMDGKRVMFVEAEGRDGYEQREVTLGRSDSLNFEILSGLHDGERYVSSGGFFLKADAQKESFGDGHDH